MFAGAKSWLWVVSGVLVAAMFVVGCAGDDDDSGELSASDDDADDDTAADDDTLDDDTFDDDADDDGPTRPFYMAAAPVQYQIDPYDVNTVFDLTGFDGRVDMVSAHMDFFGLPWEEYADGESLPAAWTQVMEEFRSAVEALGLPVYLSLTPLGGVRDTLMGRAWDDGGKLEIEDDWAGPCYDFATAPDAQRYHDAYLAYVADMVDRFDPVFVSNVIEMNLYQFFCPDAFDGLVSLANDAYDLIKSLKGDVPVFPTLVAASLWGQGGFGGCEYPDTTCLQQNLADLTGIQRDRMALSSYAMFEFSATGEVPSDFYTRIADLSGERVVFSETGYSNRVIRIPTGEGDACFDVFQYDDDKQIAFLDNLFTQAAAMDSDLVVWWSLRDYLPESMLADCPCSTGLQWCALYDAVDGLGLLPAWLAWGSMGIFDHEQNPKSVVTRWNDWFTRNRIP